MDPDKTLEDMLDACKRWYLTDDEEAKKEAKEEAADRCSLLYHWMMDDNGRPPLPAEDH